MAGPGGAPGGRPGGSGGVPASRGGRRDGYRGPPRKSGLRGGTGSEVPRPEGRASALGTGASGGGSMAAAASVMAEEIARSEQHSSGRLSARGSPSGGRPPLPPSGSLSTHPDAVARRYAARLRSAARQAAANCLESGTQWWEIMPVDNVTPVKDAAALLRELDRASATGDNVVVEIFSPGCESCKRNFMKTLKVQLLNKGTRFLRLPQEAAPEFCEEHGVGALPHFLEFQGGSEEPSRGGAIEDFSDVLDIPQDVLSLDPARYCATGDYEPRASEPMSATYIVLQALNL